MKKILKIIWFIIGGIIFLPTLILYIKLQSAQGLGVIGAALLFAVGLGILFIYLIITFLFVIIKRIRKTRRLKKKKNIKYL